EADSVWNKSENKVTWKSLDGRLTGSWTLRTPDERHMKMAAKDAQGRPLYEVDAIALRVQRADGWIQLFNGKNLTGWIVPPPGAGKGDWHVDKLGNLVGKGPSSYLFTQRDDFGDFHLRAEVSAVGGTDSGIFFR